MANWIPPEQRTEADIRSDLNADFARWDFIKEHGCSDPHWADGFNMNLVRGHIIGHYRLLEEKLTANAQLSLFDRFDLSAERPVPPEVPNDWMSPTGMYPDRLNRKKGREA